MMKKQVKNWLVVGLFLCCISGLKAQVNPHPGYIITLQNDTISGIIDYRTATANSHNCIFWREGDTKSQTFSPADILGYRLTDIGKYYVSRTVELNGKKETCFLEYLIKGIVDLYYLYSEDGNHFFFENEVGEVYSTCVEGSGELGGDGNWRQRRMQTIRPIFEVFQESPETQKKLMESNLDKKNLSELTKEYHSRVCTSAEECVKFEYDTDERAFRVKLHVAAGASYYILNIDQVDWGFNQMARVVPNIGVGMDMYFPRISNRAYAQLFFSYSPINLRKKNVIYQNGVNKIPYTYHWDATLFDAHLGAAYRLGNRKLVPILQLGFSGSFFTGTDAGTDAIRGDGSSWTDFMFMKENICWGGYTGLIFEYPLKQHTLYANLSYQYNKTSTFKAQVISCRIGYKF